MLFGRDYPFCDVSFEVNYRDEKADPIPRDALGFIPIRSFGLGLDEGSLLKNESTAHDGGFAGRPRSW